MITFVFLYVSCLVVPGWALLSLFRLNNAQHWFFYPITSLSSFLALVTLFRLLSIPFSWFSIIYFVFVAALVGLNIVLHRAQLTFSLRFNFSREKLWMIIFFTVLALYALTVGPYQEIPSDPLWHSAKILEASEFWLHQQTSWALPLSQGLSKNNFYWYHFCAWLITLSGVGIEDGLKVIWVVNFMILMGSFFAFSKVILKDGDFTERQVLFGAALAVLFFIFHFGIGPFSFVRYYAFAPAYLAFTGYWSVTILVWRFLRGESGLISSATLGLFLGLGTFMLHQQEALYIVVISAMLIGTMFWRNIQTMTASGGAVQQLWSSTASRRVLVTFGLLVIGYLVVHSALYLFKVRNFVLEGEWMVPLSDLLPFAKNLFILNPTGQFFQVLTIWGAWVYVVYFIFAGGGRLPALIVAGLWVPVWTVFNPVFIDLFLRISWPEVVWRLCYLMPLEILMAWMVVRWVTAIQESGQWYTKIRNALLCLISVFLLLPFDIGYVFNQYSKIHMLKPVSGQADYRQLSDLIMELETFPPQRVLTDQVTGYVVNAYTRHEYRGHKFYGTGSINTNRVSYETDYFSDYRGGLLVVNGRKGSHSQIGTVSGHWPTNIRHYKALYGAPFLQFVADRLDLFVLLKEFDHISIYRITDEP